MNVYVITLLENNKIVGVFNTENRSDILEGMLQYFYVHGYTDNDPELVADFIAQWVEQDIDCLGDYGFKCTFKILNDYDGFGDF